MNILKKIDLFMNKGDYIKVLIVDNNKRQKTHFIKIKSEDTFSINERQFIIDPKSVRIDEQGFPSYLYYIDNPRPANDLDLTNLDLEERKALDEEGDPEDNLSSKKLYDIVEETISKKIIRYALDGDKKIINAIYLSAGAVSFVVAGASYFLYTHIVKINEFIAENSSLIEAIRQALMNGGVN